MRGYGDFEAEKEAVVRRQSRGGPNIFLLLHVFATAKQPLNVDSNAPFSPAAVVAAAKASVASEAASVVLLACACLRLCGCALLGTFYTRSSSSSTSSTTTLSTLRVYSYFFPYSIRATFFYSFQFLLQPVVVAAAVDRQSFDMHESPDE